MINPKPLFVLWSKTAVARSGPNMAALQSELIDEAMDITSQTHDWFLHALSGDQEDECYVCTGHEMPERWEIYVQAGRYLPMQRLREDHPDPRRRGQMIKFPKATESEDNEVFALFEDIEAERQ